MEHPTSNAGCASPPCHKCGGLQLAITEAESLIRSLARAIERGQHTARGRKALADLPAAKQELQRRREAANEHARTHERAA